MSLRVRLREDLTRHESRFFGRATLRNIIWGGVALACVVATSAMMELTGVPIAMASWLNILIGLPALAMGFWRPRSGQKPEEYAADMLSHVLGPRAWAFGSESPYLAMAAAAVATAREGRGRGREKGLSEADDE